MQVQEFIMKLGRFARDEVKHDETLSTMINAKHLNLVVIHFPPLPIFIFFFTFYLPCINVDIT